MLPHLTGGNWFQQLTTGQTTSQLAKSVLGWRIWTPPWTPLFALLLVFIPTFARAQNVTLPFIIGQFDSKKAKAKDTSSGVALEAKAKLVTVQLNGTPSFKTHILEANLSDFGKRFGTFGARVDGILGQDLLQRFSCVAINYKAQTIEMVQ